MGKKIAIGSVDALESVGKSALHILTVEEEVTSGNSQKGKKSIRPFFVASRETPNHHPTTVHLKPASNNFLQEELSFEEKINKNYFDELGGAATLQQFEHISIDRSLKTQKLESKSSEEEKKNNTEFATLIKELLDESESNETNILELPTVLVSEKVTKAIDILSKVKISAIDFSEAKKLLAEDFSSVAAVEANEKFQKEHEIIAKALDDRYSFSSSKKC